MHKETGKHQRQHFIVWISATLCVCSVILMVAVLLDTKVEYGEFVPPPFEKTAIKGEPEVPKELGYGEISQIGVPFSTWICGNVVCENSRVIVFFTNPATNTAWLKLRICDAQGEILGESGVLKAGEYVEAVSLTKEILPGTVIRMKVMAYEAITYYSEGAIVIETVIR